MKKVIPFILLVISVSCSKDKFNPSIVGTWRGPISYEYVWNGRTTDSIEVSRTITFEDDGRFWTWASNGMGIGKDRDGRYEYKGTTLIKNFLDDNWDGTKIRRYDTSVCTVDKTRMMINQSEYTRQ